MAYIEFSGVEKRYGKVQAVSRFDLSIEKGELVALLGPSGCGKTTTLRMLAGFVPVSAGRLSVNGRDITDEPPYRRNIGMVFQGYALFPHMSAAHNVAFGLHMRGMNAVQIAERVRVALDRVRLSEFADRMPGELSGGQRQRVALARAMAIHPDVLLLDEPLSALDARLRHDVRNEIRQLQRATGLTTLMVTHDQDEALSMADRLVVMNQGCIEQIGSPAELYERPNNRFVADFMGRSNFINGTVTQAGRFVSEQGQTLYFDGPATSGPATLSFRPERTRVLPTHAMTSADVSTSTSTSISTSDSTDTGNDLNTLIGTVTSLTYLGPVIECLVHTDDGIRIAALLVNGSDPMAQRIAQGARIGVQWSRRDTRVLA